MNISVSRADDLDSYLTHNNTQRPHQGRMMEGQTPYSMFKKGLKLTKEDSL
jgi:hypothetical protein